MNLLKKYTLITGASSGFGEQFALNYAQQQHNLILVARSAGKLETLASELRANYNISVVVIPMDLSQLDAAEQLFQVCQKQQLDINFLINNAGLGSVGPFENEDIARTQEMMIVNMLSLTKLTHYFLPQLKLNQGKILNVGSQAGFQGVPYMASYAATKAYVLHFSEALNYELEKSGVKVMVLAPGATHTNFFTAANSSLDKTRLITQTSDVVVKTAMRGVAKNKLVIVTSVINKLLNFGTRFIPRRLVLKIAAYFMRE